MKKPNDLIIDAWLREYEGKLRHYFMPRARFIDVDDLVQEVFLQLHLQAIHNRVIIISPKHYIFTLARNILVSRIREKKQFAIAHHFADGSELELTHTISAERSTIAIEECQRLEQLISKMPLGTRSAFCFHRFE